MISINIIKELSLNQTVLLIISNTSYSKKTTEIAKKLAKGSLCYITLNKTFDSLKTQFEKKKVNTENIVFIDAISKTIMKKPNQTKNSYFVDSPGSLTDLSLMVSKFLRHNFDYLIVDSINSLLIYRDEKTVKKFIQHITNQIKQSKTKAVLFAINLKDQETFVKESSMFMDNVVKSA